MRLTLTILAILLGAITAQASTTVLTSVMTEETKDLFKGSHVEIEAFHKIENNWFKEVRAGLHYLSGEYQDDGPSVTNLTSLLGVTVAHDKWYWENDVEISQNDNRKPFWSALTQVFFSVPSSEIGLGYRQAQFKNQDLKLALITYRYFLTDTSFLTGTAYLPTTGDDYKAYRLGLRMKPLFNSLTVDASYAWGKSLEDIGIEQEFKSVGFNISNPLSQNIDMGLNLTRTWGEIFDQEFLGISGLWKF